MCENYRSAKFQGMKLASSTVRGVEGDALFN